MIEVRAGKLTTFNTYLQTSVVLHLLEDTSNLPILGVYSGCCRLTNAISQLLWVL